MSWFRRLIKLSNILAEQKKPVSPSGAIPVVQFDSSLVTDAVKADLRKNIGLIEGLDGEQATRIYDVALVSVSKGRDLHCIADMLMSVCGMSNAQAAQVALSLSNKATGAINRERQAALGITHGIWLYSGAPCMKNPRAPTESDIRQDAAHQSANGKRFEIRKGLLVSRKRIWPGVEEGCKCSLRPVLPF